MDVTRDRLSQLFHKYYHGAATEDEKKEMMELIRLASSDAELSVLMREAWEKLEVDKALFTSEVRERMRANILYSEKGQDNGYVDKEMAHPASGRNPLQMWYWAAAVVVMCGLGAFWRWNAGKQISEYAVAVQSDIRPGRNQATLTLANGSVVLLDSTAKGSVIRQGTAQISKAGDGELVYRQSGKDHADDVLQMNAVSTPRGGQYQITLPDGTRAWLNASSSIRFPVTFDKHERRIEIEGEVYFQVRKDKSRPFRVQFGTSEIEVLGTSFNVMNYKDEHVSQTTLEEGSLIVKTGSRQSKLQPGEQASIAGKGSLTVEKVDVEEAIAWKDGLFNFQDAGIEEVMRQIARWYDVEVIYEGPVPRRQFTGTVTRNIDIVQLMTMLQYAGVNYRINGGKILIL